MILNYAGFRVRVIPVKVLTALMSPFRCSRITKESMSGFLGDYSVIRIQLHPKEQIQRPLCAMNTLKRFSAKDVPLIRSVRET